MKLKKANLKSLHAQVVKSKKIIAGERDKLRNTLWEIEQIIDASDNACQYLDDLNRAIDELSQYV